MLETYTVRGAMSRWLNSKRGAWGWVEGPLKSCKTLMDINGHWLCSRVCLQVHEIVWGVLYHWRNEVGSKGIEKLSIWPWSWLLHSKPQGLPPLQPPMGTLHHHMESHYWSLQFPSRAVYTLIFLFGSTAPSHLPSSARIGLCLISEGVQSRKRQS